MKKIYILLSSIFLLFLFTPVLAFDITTEVKQNIYTNERLGDTPEALIKLQYSNFFLFGSYKEPFLRLMGQNVGHYKILGMGIGYKNNITDSLSIQFFPGVYATNIDIIYQTYIDGYNYNEGIHRYLNFLYGDELWRYYDIETSPALGINLDVQWEKEFGHILIEASLGYRYLRIPIRIQGWNDDSWKWGWENYEMEDMSGFNMGVSLGIRF